MNTKQILGLTCISEELKEKDKQKYSFRTMTRKRFKDLCIKVGRDEAIKELSDRIIHNICVTQSIIEHCHLNNIKHYRISSALFPLLTDGSLGISFSELPNEKQINNELRFVGLLLFSFKISASIHPDQFNVLASLNEDAVQRTINELNFQSMILDRMGLPQDHSCPMNIHLNCPLHDSAEDIPIDADDEYINNFLISKVADKFYHNLMQCDDGVINRLTLENEDKGHWNVDNIIKLSEIIFHNYNLNIPICYDNLHDSCNPSEVESVCWQAERCAYTWVNQGKSDNDFISPIFHWSEGLPKTSRSCRLL